MLNSHCLLDSEPFSCGLCFHGFITCLVVSIEGLQDIIGLWLWASFLECALRGLWQRVLRSAGHDMAQYGIYGLESGYGLCG